MEIDWTDVGAWTFIIVFFAIIIFIVFSAIRFNEIAPYRDDFCDSKYGKSWTYDGQVANLEINKCVSFDWEKEEVIEKYFTYEELTGFFDCPNFWNLKRWSCVPK